MSEAVEYVFSPQGSQDCVPPDETFPDAQFVQPLSVRPPPLSTTSAYFPAAHSKQDTLLSAIETKPLDSSQ